jgi:beta-galactosidase beta subunit
MHRNVVATLCASFALACSALAQTAPPIVVPPAIHPSVGVDYRPASMLEEMERRLLEAAKDATSGSASITLDKTPTHFTMLASRVKSGGAELHRKYADLFVVLSGEGTEITGGTIKDAKESGDETRGTGLEGGVSQPLHQGDTILIPPNTPHQTLVAPGSTLTYYVVKVATPPGE